MFHSRGFTDIEVGIGTYILKSVETTPVETPRSREQSAQRPEIGLERAPYGVLAGGSNSCRVITGTAPSRSGISQAFFHPFSVPFPSF